jgi:hypothetical protein
VLLRVGHGSIPFGLESPEAAFELGDEGVGAVVVEIVGAEAEVGTLAIVVEGEGEADLGGVAEPVAVEAEGEAAEVADSAGGELVAAAAFVGEVSERLADVAGEVAAGVNAPWCGGGRRFPWRTGRRWCRRGG